MTEQKRMREQVASHGYAVEAPRTLRRVVTVPTADPAVAWNTFSQRQERLRRERQERARPKTYVNMASRTLAQTGIRATSGRIKAVHRLPQSQSAPIPTRSGRVDVKRRGWFWRLLGLFAIVGIVALGAGFALTSNAFRIEQVNVVGTHDSKLTDSIQQMGMQGQNIFLLDVAAMTGRIETNPLVESATLSRQFPNQLAVSIVERTPVLLWQTAQGSYSVDKYGVVIAPTSAATGHLLSVMDMRKPVKGQTVQAGTHLDAAAIAFAQTIFNRLPTVTGIMNFTLRYESDGSYTVVGPNGWLAYLGNAQDTNPLDNRLIELQAILRLAQQQQLTLATIDVRYGLHPVYTTK